MIKHRKPFTAAEDAIIIEMTEQGYACTHAAKELKRAYSIVSTRARVLGVAFVVTAGRSPVLPVTLPDIGIDLTEEEK